ncbi:RNA polymerase factor sigma-54 [Emcibacter sp. SYSU 3D8]|uniref:RNA polymerase factor sigma-54 n=1 Tax=Emcibacter sp. SYSU 3D8 TaxID=3133969 RepID=UPI0031FF35F6
MATGLRQVLRQGQQLVMTQQLQQAIKLLQLSSIDLVAFVEEQVESNPLLEFDYGPADAASPPETGPAALAPADGGDAPLDSRYDNVFTNDDRDMAPAPPVDDGIQALPASPWTTSSGGGDTGPGLDATARLAVPTTLRGHLSDQLGMTVDDGRMMMIGRYLIDLVDDAGYLREALTDVSDRLGCTVADVEETLALLQQFDPPGVCARDLAECLALQLKDRNRYDPAMETLVANLTALADGRTDWLKRQCGVSDEDFADMLMELRALDPKPGLAFDRPHADVVVPDVLISYRGDGAWGVELNADVLPRVLVNAHYYAEVRGASRSKHDRAYLSDCFSNASWLAKALDQRAKTILKVASELVRRQEGFFTHGVSHLRPLNLKQVADAIGMHESTVSRVTAGKYLACPRGTFELKYFFTAAISATGGGDSHSAEAVRHRIRELIDGEDPRAVLSDDKIVEMLVDADIDIARRTVAKYREAMHIPSSVQRRRLKSGR